MQEIKWILNKNNSEQHKLNCASLFGKEEINGAMECLGKTEIYKPTPLYKLEALSEKLGIEGLYVKDESCRLGHKSFKVLGGFYAILKYLAKKLGKEISEINFSELKSGENRINIGELTFSCATDGNHGFGVAWTAQQLRQKAVIYMPKGSSQKRVEYIETTGAKVIVTDKNYDDSVRMAVTDAEKNGWVCIQDTAWEGYTEIPCNIIRGYSIIAAEALEQMKANYGTRPSHVFVQAGVGALAAAIIGYFADVFPEDPPFMVVVEPNTADCIFQSVKTGELTKLNGDFDTIMAGLSCGEPNPIAWNIIKKNCNGAASVPDDISEKGMRILAKPLKNDKKLVSGESGAVTTGLAAEIFENSQYCDLKKAFKLNQNSKILVISTEGDTDPDIYQKIVYGREA